MSLGCVCVSVCICVCVCVCVTGRFSVLVSALAPGPSP